MSFDIDSTELIYLVLGPGVLLLAALLLRIDLRLKARFDELTRRVDEAESALEALTLHDDEGDVERREIEDRVEMLSRQQEQIMLRDSETGPYFQAIRHAESGAGVEALIERTGVTRAEAELIFSLHGRAGQSLADDGEADEEGHAGHRPE